MSVQAASLHRTSPIAPSQARASSSVDAPRPQDSLAALATPERAASAPVAVSPGLPGQCPARPEALLPGIGVEWRNETTGRRTVALWRTLNVQETAAKHYPTLRVVDAVKLFKPGTVFFGFGKPNVYLAIVGEDKAHKVDAKSLCREKTKLSETRGNVQSGVFIVPRDLPQEAVDAVLAAAREKVGGRDITCASVNSKILKEAGFTLNGRSIERTMPADLLNALLKGPVHYRGQRVRFDLIRTAPQKLDDFMSDVSKATNRTPYRHAPSCIQKMLPCCAMPVTVDAPPTLAQQAQPLLALPEELAARDPGPEHTMHFSVASRLGGAMRRVWGPHPIVTFSYPPHVDVNAYLPQKLKAFDIANPSLVTRVKRDVVFCKPVQRLLRHGLSKYDTEPLTLREENVPGMINQDEKHNLVVTTEGLKFMSIEGNSKVADWLLSKHVLVAGRHADVRFAGELWKDDAGVIHINRNSGTYRPSSEQLTGAIAMATTMFPTLKFQAEDFGA